MIEALDDYLERAIEKTIEGDVAAAFLRRRARILHHRRGMPSEAADAYLRLWALRPDDPDVFRHLRVCLLETGRVHELISAAERALEKTSEDPARITLMREIARLWEEEAKNTWEARDAWKRVLDSAPEDSAAMEALARLETRAKA
jgi:tetratricopeptide (TPR) repeat protein